MTLATTNAFKGSKNATVRITKSVIAIKFYTFLFWMTNLLQLTHRGCLVATSCISYVDQVDFFFLLILWFRILHRVQILSKCVNYNGFYLTFIS